VRSLTISSFSSALLFIFLLIFFFSCRPKGDNTFGEGSNVAVQDSLADFPQDSVKIYSAAMKKDIDLNVILPSSYNPKRKKPYPVLYLLHGANGNENSWTQYSPLMIYANAYDVIIICPNGGSTGWYLDSPVDSTHRYETFFCQELLPWVDERLHTRASPSGRGICGLSMGGHGAFYLAIRHADLWGAAGSISGGMDLRPFPKNWNLEEILGDQKTYPDNWLSHSVVGQLDSLKKGQPQLYFDCGEEDFFFEVNKALRDSLQRRGISHTYQTRPGEHNWTYFATSLPKHLQFFSEFFTKAPAI